MTAQELIDELKRFHPSDEIEIETLTKAVPSETFTKRFVIVDEGDNEVANFDVSYKTEEIPAHTAFVGIERVLPNNGHRRRILIQAEPANEN